MLVQDVIAQPFNYSVANAHSHNDYNNPVPFYAAYTEGFGSIEADILMTEEILYVGHNADDIKLNRTLEDFYLKPLGYRLCRLPQSVSLYPG